MPTATQTTTARKPVAPAHGTASLTLRINDSEYALWKVPAHEAGVTACYELKKKGSSDRYHVSEHAHGAECTCGDWTFRRNHLDPAGCKHIKALAVFGLIEPPAPVPTPPPPPAPAPRLTREAITTGAGVHPLEAKGIGPAPFTLFATICLPGWPGGVARRSAAIEAAERLYRVKAGFCYACKQQGDETFVVERADRKNAAVCRKCLNQAGDGGLLRKLAHLDHEADRLARQGDRDRGRR